MPEPLKNLYSAELIAQMGAHLRRVHPAFDAGRFVSDASRDLETLELKQRAAQIRDALDTHLPSDYGQMIDILLASLHPEEDVELSAVGMDAQGIRGWAVMPMSDLVGRRCEEDFDLALQAQKALTKRFSSEFGIRYSILANPERAMETIGKWTEDRNYHVRRLASEGTRPRLPWAMQLPMFIDNPAIVLPLLDRLKDDPSEYVRRSVANNLNDIAKDHADTAAEVALGWSRKADTVRMKTVRHAMRTLIKQGHPAALEAIGISAPDIDVTPVRVLTPTVEFGDALEFSAELHSTSKQDQKLVIDYVIGFRKANGTRQPKVFKLKTLTLAPGATHRIERRHPIRPITTRRYYDGEHSIALQINGQAYPAASFQLNGC